MSSMKPTHIVETSLYSTDLERSEDFYSNTLNLKLINKQEGRHLFYELNSGKLLIFNPERSMIDNGRVPPHGTTGSTHMAFGIEGGEYDRWKQYLQEKGVEIQKEVEWPTGQRSLYFNDPTGNGLEMITELIKA